MNVCMDKEGVCTAYVTPVGDTCAQERGSVEIEMFDTVRNGLNNENENYVVDNIGKVQFLNVEFVLIFNNF